MSCAWDTARQGQGLRGKLSFMMMEASVLMVFGHWESACSSWQGWGGFLVNVSLFPRTNTTPLFIKEKANPSHVGCLSHGLKQANFTQSCPGPSHPCSPERGSLTVAALALGHAPPPTQAAACMLTAALLWAERVSAFLFPDSRHFSPMTG